MKKWQMENSEKSEILEISEKLFRLSFFRVFDFALQPKSKTRIKSSRKKISEISEVSKFSTWPKFFPVCIVKNFANFTGKHLWLSHFLIKLQAYRDSITSAFLWFLRNFQENPLYNKNSLWLI